MAKVTASSAIRPPNRMVTSVDLEQGLPDLDVDLAVRRDDLGDLGVVLGPLLRRHLLQLGDEAALRDDLRPAVLGLGHDLLPGVGSVCSAPSLLICSPRPSSRWYACLP